MNSISINGVTIERDGNQWQAFANGVCCYSHNPMMAFLSYERSVRAQEFDDLSEQFFNVKADLLKMQEVAA